MCVCSTEESKSYRFGVTRGFCFSQWFWRCKSVCALFQSTGERGDLSCGWAFLKLFDESGAPITLRYTHIPLLQFDWCTLVLLVPYILAHKIQYMHVCRTQELTIHGGTPFERDTDMDTTSTKRGNVLSQKYPYISHIQAILFCSLLRLSHWCISADVAVQEDTKACC